jgi:hypothetical protein
VTKNWTGGSGWIAPHTPGTPYMFTVEAGAQGQRLDTPGTAIMPYADALTGSLDPTRFQSEDIDWTAGGQVRVTYRPEGSAWTLSGGVRYGRVNNSTGRLRQEEVTGDAVCRFKTSDAYTPYLPGVDLSFIGKLFCDPEYGPVTKDIPPFGTKYFQNKYRADYVLSPQNRLSSSTDRREDHLIVDFDVGKDMGLGVLGVDESSVRAGLRYADFKSSISGDMRAVPDMVMPQDAWAKYNTTFHQYVASFAAEREFKGAGPTLSWEASRPVLGTEDAGHFNIDWSISAGALYGKQKTSISGTQGSQYFNATYPTKDFVLGLQAPDQTPFEMHRTKSVFAPMLDLSLGLSFDVPGVKLSTGYRWERYFNVLDAGFTEHQSYDRTVDGPFFKVAIGLGGG